MGSECADEQVRKLDEVIKQQFQTAKRCLREMNAELGMDMSEQTFSKIRSEARKMPVEVYRWVMYRYNFGTAFVELRKTDSPLLRSLCYTMERDDFEALVILATELIGVEEGRWMSGEKSDFLPRLYAFRSVGQSAKGATYNAYQDFKVAADRAQDVAPELYPRYFISACVWESQLDDQRFKQGYITDASWKKKLRSTMAAVAKTVPSRDVDKKLRLQLLMRNASRINDKPVFVHWLNEARKCSGFGATPESIDKSIKDWMSEPNDLDGDFRNARSYQQYSDL